METPVQAKRMQREHIVKILTLLGVRPSELEHSARWVRAPCPLAPWLHASGKDSHPSFGVRVDDGESVFNCFACESGSLDYLLRRMRQLGARPPRYQLAEAGMVLLTCEAESTDLSIKQYGDDDPVDADDQTPWSEDWLQSFLLADRVKVARDYLYSRGVSVETSRFLGIRYDSFRGCVCFPVRNFEGELVGMRGRYIEPGERRYHAYDWNGHRSSLVWYWEHALRLDRPVVMVESVFDHAAVWPHYANVVAPLSVGISQAKVKRMACTMEIITLFDRGEGGDKARTQVQRYLGNRVVEHLQPPEHRKDPGEMTGLEIRELLKLLPLRGD